jgi:predicted transposase/invertase (TIGR01784 family)
MSRHDALFKKAFEDLDSARGELRAVLPEGVSALIEWDTLAVEKGTFVDPALRSRLTDLLFSVRLAGREARIYLLFEHHSKRDRWMPFRVLAYEVRIWEAWRRAHPKAKKLPPILAIVLAQVPGGWKGPTALFQVIEFSSVAERVALAPLMPQLTVVVDDLAMLTDAMLEARALPETAKLALAALQHVRDRTTLESLGERMAHWIAQLPDTEAAAEMLLSVTRYVESARPDADAEKFQAAVARAAPQVEDKFMATIRQIEERGEARGLALGRQHTLAATLVKLLTQRFSEVPHDVRARISTAEPATLDRWIERVITAPSIEAVLAD